MQRGHRGQQLHFALLAEKVSVEEQVDGRDNASDSDLRSPNPT